MFDMAFSELAVVGVVALIVIGPERLPRVARTVGSLFGRLQRYVTDIKADINREMELEELGKFRDQFQNSANVVGQTIRGDDTNVDKKAPHLNNSSNGNEDLAESPIEVKSEKHSDFMIADQSDSDMKKNPN